MQTTVMPGIRALVALARIVGKRHGLEVVFDRQVKTAATDGKRVYLPVISNLGNEDHATLIEGLLDHEGGHCRHSDFDFLRTMKGSPLLFALQNVFEDVWMEREQARIYPGCARNIRKAMVVMMELGWFGPPKPDSQHPGSVVTNFILMGLRARWFNLDELDDAAEQHRQHAISILGEELVGKIWDVSLKVDSASSTSDAFDLASQIIELLTQAAAQAEENPQQEPEQEQQDEQSEDGGSSSSAAGQPDDVDQADEAAGAEAENAGGSDNASPSSDSSAGDEVGEGASLPSGQSVRTDVIRDVLDASAEEIGSTELADRILEALSDEEKAGATADSTDHADIETEFGEVPPRLGSAETHEADRLVEEISRPIEVRLGTQLESLLETRTDCTVTLKRAGRKLASSRIPGMRMGRLQAFVSREEGDGIDTVVAVLEDNSGSMKWDFTAEWSDDLAPRRITSAAAVAFSLSQVLDRHSIPFALYGFGSRFCAYKRFEQSWTKCKRHTLCDSLGGTHTDYAVMRVSDEILARPESRKLIVLVTDGAPARPLETVAAMTEARSLGIELAVVYIGEGEAEFNEMLKDAGYPVAAALSRDELSKAVFTAVKSAF